VSPLRRRGSGTLPIVLAQHVEDASSLWMLRTLVADAPHARLDDLARFDQRLEASLEGIAIAGADGTRACERALDAPLAGDVFVAAVRAITAPDPALFDRLFAIAAAMPEVRPGLVSALGWVAPGRLSGWVVGLLGSHDAHRIVAGLAACGMHRVDPGAALLSAIRHHDASVRARAVRLMGELGAERHRVPVDLAIDDADDGVAVEAARAAVLLGDRGRGLDRLLVACVSSGRLHPRAWEVALRASDGNRAHATLRAVGADPSGLRDLVVGAGMVGEARYLPWLVERMADDDLARVAGEAFVLLTGCDLDGEGLTRATPPDHPTGPSDDPADSAVAMDPDEHLPWPDAEKVSRWLHAQRARFAAYPRWFLGAEWSPRAASRGLQAGFQRQRRAAAVLLALHGGGALFDVRARAGRQRRLLAR